MGIFAECKRAKSAQPWKNTARSFERDRVGRSELIFRRGKDTRAKRRGAGIASVRARNSGASLYLRKSRIHLRGDKSSRARRFDVSEAISFDSLLSPSRRNSMCTHTRTPARVHTCARPRYTSISDLAEIESTAGIRKRKRERESRSELPRRRATRIVAKDNTVPSDKLARITQARRARSRVCVFAFTQACSKFRQKYELNK